MGREEVPIHSPLRWKVLPQAFCQEIACRLCSAKYGFQMGDRLPLNTFGSDNPVETRKW